MRAFLLLGFALLLGACNRVYTSEPLFAIDETAGAPALREGVWRTDYSLAVSPEDLLQAQMMEGLAKDGLDCPVDETKPAKAWYPCGHWVLAVGREMRSWRIEFTEADMRRMRRGGPLKPPSKGQWKSVSYVIADGEPMILQVAVPVKDMYGPEYASDEDGHPMTQYAYFGVVVTRRGADGRIEALESWPVLCGPPPPPPPADSEDPEDRRWPRPSTLEPFAGLEMEGDQACTADSPEVLRAAALASRTLATSNGAARWVSGARP